MVVKVGYLNRLMDDQQVESAINRLGVSHRCRDSSKRLRAKSGIIPIDLHRSIKISKYKGIVPDTACMSMGVAFQTCLTRVRVGDYRQIERLMARRDIHVANGTAAAVLRRTDTLAAPRTAQRTYMEGGAGWILQSFLQPRLARKGKGLLLLLPPGLLCFLDSGSRASSSSSLPRPRDASSLLSSAGASLAFLVRAATWWLSPLTCLARALLDGGSMPRFSPFS